MDKVETTYAVPKYCSQTIDMHGTYLGHQEMATSSTSTTSDTFSTSLLHNLRVLKDKFHQVQSLVIENLAEPSQVATPTSKTIASMATLMEEIIVTASSMMFTCQQLALEANSHNNQHDKSQQDRVEGNLSFQVEGRQEEQRQSYSCDTLEWYGDYVSHDQPLSQTSQKNKGSSTPKEVICDGNIVELTASDLLAKYTHYCQICGKGFKRDANLRMHMRAHGDKYKTHGALVNPMKKKNGDNNICSDQNKDGFSGSLLLVPRKYSCPEEGCRWNQKHANFQPLKSMICVKNHYKRSHCPKLYVCKRCNRKQFSVLSDLRTHEKHCGVLKWQCSCGNTFSRKDKLMGHVSLFVGHTPVFR